MHAQSRAPNCTMSVLLQCSGRLCLCSILILHVSLHVSAGLPRDKHIGLYDLKPPPDDFVVVPWDLVFDASQHLKEIVRYIKEFDDNGDVRVHHCFDLFGGAFNMGLCFREAGLRAVSSDVKSGGISQNILCAEGFFNILKELLRVLPYGIFIAGPPCSLWICLSSSWHLRKAPGFEGDTCKMPVVMANILVTNLVCLLSVAAVRWVWPLIEQPASSVMWKLWCMDAWQKTMQSEKVTTWMKCFNHGMPKPTQLRTLLPCGSSLKRIWSKQREKTQDYMPTTKKGVLALSPKQLQRIKRRTTADPVKLATPKCKIQPGTDNESMGPTDEIMKVVGEVNDTIKEHLETAENAPSGKQVCGRPEREKVYTTNKNGWVSGGRDLPDSAIYTKEFCKATVAAYLSSLKTIEPANPLDLALQIKHPTQTYWDMLQANGLMDTEAREKANTWAITHQQSSRQSGKYAKMVGSIGISPSQKTIGRFFEVKAPGSKPKRNDDSDIVAVIDPYMIVDESVLEEPTCTCT
jgi:hypothetical protein